MDGAFLAESVPLPLRPNGAHHALAPPAPATASATIPTSPSTGGILSSFLRTRPQRSANTSTASSTHPSTINANANNANNAHNAPNNVNHAYDPPDTAVALPARTPPTPSAGFGHILRRRRSAGQVPSSPPPPPVPSVPVPATAGFNHAHHSHYHPHARDGHNIPPGPATAPLPAPSAMGGGGGGGGGGGIGPSHRLRLVPQIDSRRSLRFDPIARDVAEGAPALRIGRFTDRSSSNAARDGHGNNNNNPNSNKLAFKSKVVSRAHAEIWCERSSPSAVPITSTSNTPARFFIRDTRSSSGTFLNHVRLSAANAESRPYELRDGDVVQLGVDYQGGAEEMYKCVRMRVEIGREWQAGANAFNTNALKQLKALSVPGNKVSAASATPAPSKSGFSDCCICLFSVTIQQALFIAPCSHSFHYKCIRPLLETNHPSFSCPLCRTYADLDEDVEVDVASLAPSAEEEDDVIGGGEDGIGAGALGAMSGPGRIVSTEPLAEVDEHDIDEDMADADLDGDGDGAYEDAPAHNASQASLHTHSVHSSAQSVHSHAQSSFHSHSRAHAHYEDEHMYGVPEEPAPAYDDIVGPAPSSGSGAGAGADPVATPVPAQSTLVGRGGAFGGGASSEFGVAGGYGRGYAEGAQTQGLSRSASVASSVGADGDGDGAGEDGARVKRRR